MKNKQTFTKIFVVRIDCKKARIKMETYDILTTKELENEVYSEKIKSAESKYEGETLVALQNFFDYIKKLGGVRKDVFLYLLEHPIANKYYFAEILDLFHDNAALEWFELIIKAQNHYTNGRFMIKEIMMAYESGIAVEDVAEYMGKARNPFEMSRYRLSYHNENDDKLQTALLENISKVFEEMSQENNDAVVHAKELDNERNKELEERILQLEKELEVAKEEKYSSRDSYIKEKEKNVELRVHIKELEEMLEQEKKDIENSASKAEQESYQKQNQLLAHLEQLESRINQLENMRFLVPNEGQSDRYMPAQIVEVEPEPEEPLLEPTEKEPDQKIEEEMVVHRDEPSKEPEEQINESVAEKSSMDVEAYKSEAISATLAVDEVSDDVNEQEVMKKEKILLTDLAEQEEKSGKRLSFFSTLLKHHMRIQFLKLPEERQSAKLFEIMIGKGYGKKEIRLVRVIKDSGMNYEFLYNLIDSNVTLDKLEELVEAFAPATTSDDERDFSVNGDVSNETEEEEMPFPDDDGEMYI